MARNAVAAKRRKQTINEDDLAPGLAAGLTQGPRALEEAEERFKPNSRDGADLVRHMNEESAPVIGTRLSAPRFVVEPNAQVIQEPNTGRVMLDVTKTYTHDQVLQIQAGNRCLICGEPQPDAFPASCNVCGYAMRDRQILDFAIEFEGDKHIGPARPISDYLAEQDERVEKSEFERAIRGGRSPMRDLH